jgi:hypothetical protein
MRVRNVFVSAALLLAGGLATAIPAAAAPAGLQPEPWQPVEAGDFAVAAGRLCTFGFQAHITENQELFRVDARYPDGAPRIEEFRGKLLVQFTNASTGRSVIWDLSGYGLEELYPDGSEKSFLGIGPFSIGFRAIDPYPQGYYRLDGVHAVTIDPDGTRHLSFDGGTEENLCQTIG